MIVLSSRLRRLTLTDAGQARYAELAAQGGQHRQMSVPDHQMSVPDPQFGTKTPAGRQLSAPRVTAPGGRSGTT